MPKNNPLAMVVERFGTKSKLVDALATVLEPHAGESADDLKKRLSHVANRKLLHLHAVAEKAKKLGGKAAVVAKVAELRGQAKDASYVTKLGKASLPKLLDLVGSHQRRSKSR